MDGNNLVFQLGDGVTEINVGRIIPPAVNAWPVGSIFVNTSPTNPASLLDGGTWVRWGKGRFPLSLDETNTRFDTPEETGGLEYVTLDLTQIPSHNHGGVTGNESNDHTHTGYTNTTGVHNHTYFQPVTTTNTAGGTAARIGSSTSGTTTSAGNHNHTVQTYGQSASHTHAVNPAGGGLKHENMPPFIAVYMWKRTA